MSDSYPDRFIQATEEAKDRVRRAVESLPRMETALGPTLTPEEQQKMFDQRIKPLLLAGNTRPVLEWIARHAPPGTDPGKELFRMIKKLGG
jgi:hypothetical protein